MSEERIKTRYLIDATRSIQQDDTIGSRSVNDEDISYSDTRQTDGTETYRNMISDETKHTDIVVHVNDSKENNNKAKQCCCIIL